MAKKIVKKIAKTSKIPSAAPVLSQSATAAPFEGVVYSYNVGLRGATGGDFEIPRSEFATVMSAAGMPDELLSPKTSDKARLTTALQRTLDANERFKIVRNDDDVTLYVKASLHGKAIDDAIANRSNVVMLDKSTGTLKFLKSKDGADIEKEFRRLEEILTARQVRELIEKYIARKLDGIRLNPNSGSGWYVPARHRDAIVSLREATRKLGGKSGGFILDFVPTENNRAALGESVSNELESLILPEIEKAEGIVRDVESARSRGESPKVHGKTLSHLSNVNQTCLAMLQAYKSTMDVKAGEALERITHLQKLLARMMGLVDVDKTIPSNTPF